MADPGSLELTAEPALEPPLEVASATRRTADETPVAAPGGRPRRRTSTALAVVVALALAATAGWLGLRVRDDAAREQARHGALAAARQEAVNLTTIGYATAERDLDRIIAAATGPLAEQFRGQRAQFPDVLRREQSVSQGQVLGAGLVALDTGKGAAQAIVAVDATISNAETRQAGQPSVVKHYRMSMKLVRRGGRWLVSDVAFAGVPQ